jgi:diguanylate cyclase (GGDEF)-like protein
MPSARFEPVVTLVALQFLLHALGWALGAWLLRDQRRALAPWAAFLGFVGLGFVLMAQRGDDRSWLAFNGAALCWAAGLLMLWRGVAHHVAGPDRRRLQALLMAGLVVAHGWIGPAASMAEARVVLSYGANLLIVVLMVSDLRRPMATAYGRRGFVAVMLPAAIVGASFAVPLVRQLLSPGQPLELHRFDDANLGVMLVFLISAAIFNFSFMALVIARLLSRLRELSDRDGLTGLYNRRAAEAGMQAQWKRWQRDRQPFALALVDLDHFKRINDQLGHPVGDEALAHAARVLQQAVRADDMVARFGGEEFIVLMPGANLAPAHALGERLCQRLRQQPLSAGDSVISITASVGVAEVVQPDADAIQVLRRADQALYRAKAAGRDRVEVAAATA